MARRIIDTLWGSTGAVTDPGDAKLNLGWIAEIPTHQVQNYWQKRVDEMLQWIEQLGIQDWDAGTTYQDLGLCLGSNGVVYQSQQAANINHQPVADGGTWWEQANYTASLVAAGGYITLAGDTPLILQWGMDNIPANTTGADPNGEITLPLTYPNVHAVAVGNADVLSDTQSQPGSAIPFSLSKMYVANHDNVGRDVWWISIGW